MLNDSSTQAELPNDTVACLLTAAVVSCCRGVVMLLAVESRQQLQQLDREKGQLLELLVEADRAAAAAARTGSGSGSAARPHASSSVAGQQSQQHGSGSQKLLALAEGSTASSYSSASSGAGSNLVDQLTAKLQVQAHLQQACLCCCCSAATGCARSRCGVVNIQGTATLSTYTC
jgi:hypothetical protein